MKLNCETCGDIPEALMDGYAFGDTILEGIMFKVSIVRGKVKAVFAEPEDCYVKGLNTRKWEKEAREFADNCDDLECPTCKGTVAMIAEGI